MRFEYRGIPLLNDHRIEFEMEMTEAATDLLPPAQERDIRIDLARGQRWPDEIRRGMPISVDLNGHPFRGTVRYRRMHRLALRGVFA